MVRVTVRDSSVRRPVPEYQSGHPAGQIRIYAPSQNDLAAGYGRLAHACLEALGARWSGPNDEHELAVTSPIAHHPCAIRLTMWEPDAIPKQHDGWKRDRTIIVPSRHNYELFLREGYQGNLFVLPLWGECQPAPMPSLDRVQFVCVARDNSVRDRKRIDMLLDCFRKAFPSEKDVSLVVKQSQWCFRRAPKDDRITLIYEDWSKEKYERMLQESHCGVFLSGLEGWNFPCNELMACGRPSIVIPYGGPADFTTRDTSYYLDYEMVQAPSDVPYLSVGMGAKPFAEEVIEKMRHVYRNREEMKRKGELSQERSKLFTKEIFQRQLRLFVKAALGRV